MRVSRQAYQHLEIASFRSSRIHKYPVQNERGAHFAAPRGRFLGSDRRKIFRPDTRLSARCVDERAETLLGPSVNAPSLNPKNFVDEGLFTFLLNHEVHKATRLRYPISILCLHPDLPPGEPTPAFTNELARAAVRHIRLTDVVSILPPSYVALLLIDAEAGNLKGILERLRETLGPRGLTFSAGGGCYPQTATNAKELLQQAVERMKRAKAEGGNRLYLPKT